MWLAGVVRPVARREEKQSYISSIVASNVRNKMGQMCFSRFDISSTAP